MLCPLCEAVLKPVLYSHIEIDVCTKCNGIWFDAGEVEKYGRMIKAGTGAVPDESGFDMPRFESATKACPKCGESSLREGKFGKLPLFRCGRCAGHFLTGQPQEEDKGFLGSVRDILGFLLFTNRHRWS
jgi:Zn-finger nucleic acid-binding protein